MSMMKRFFVTMAVAVFVVFASGSYAGEEPMMNDTAMNMTMNDTMMNMTMNGTDMANDTIAEEEPASSDDGRRRLLDMHESMNDTMMNMTMNDTMGNMTMNGTDMANDTIAEEEPASSDDGRRRLLG